MTVLVGRLAHTPASRALVANAVDTVCARQSPPADPAFPKWVSTSVTNTATCIAKDKVSAPSLRSAAAAPRAGGSRGG